MERSAAIRLSAASVALAAHSLTRTQVLISARASLALCFQKLCLSAATQSSSPMSSSRRQIARARSCLLSHEVVRGKLGRTK